MIPSIYSNNSFNNIQHVNPSDQYIETMQKRIEKAKADLNKVGCYAVYNVSKNIQSYEITDQQALVEIAQKAVKRDAEAVSEFIHNYGIEDQQALIEIAKIAAFQSGYGLSRFIHNYGIEDQQALVEIAKIAADQDAQQTSKYIQNYGIEDQQALIEIAKIYVNSVNTVDVDYLCTYQIKDEKILMEFLLIDIAKDLQNWSNINNFVCLLPKNSPYKQLLTQAEEIVEKIDDKLFKENFGENFINDIRAYCFDCNKHGKTIEEQQFHQKRLLKQLYPLFVILKVLEDNGENNNQIEKYLLSIAKTKDFQLRNKILLVFVSMIVDDDRNHLLIHLPNNPSRKLTFAFDLLSVALFGENRLQLNSRIRSDREKMRKIVSSLISIHNHRDIFENKDIYSFCLNLAQGSYDEVIRNFQSTEILVELYRDDLLFDERLSAQEKINKILEELTNEKLTDKPSNYFDPILNAQSSNALFIYLSKVYQMPDTHVDAFKSFVKAVLEGNFPGIRYQIEGSLHIQKLAEKEDLFDKWKQTPNPVPLIDYLSETEGQKQGFHVKEWLQDKINHGHINISGFTELNQVVNNNQSLQEAIEKLRQTEEKTEKLQLEEQLMQLLVKGSSYTNINFLKKLAVSVLGEDSEFVQNDLKELEQKLKGETKLVQPENYSLHNSDNWEDLLLCGTEVLGSCQRVDGDPNLNQGLLGYLLDGKYRALLIKKGKEIYVRAMLRLLWDQDTPVLFLERIYSRLANSAMEQALVKYAIDQAKNYNLSLVTQISNCEESSYNKALRSLGSLSPCEYVDALNGVQEQIYTIKGTMKLLYQPFRGQMKLSA